MWSLILLAGGSGSRMGAGINKVLLPLNGKPVLRRSAEAFIGLTDEIIVAARPEDEDAVRQALNGIPFILTYGGSTRQESVWNALQAIRPESEYVMIHDGARCLVDRDTILGVKDSVLQYGTGIASIPVTDTIKVASGVGLVQSTPDRSSLRSIQTPQGFRTSVIMNAHLEALKTGFIGTDDASLLEHMGLPVRLTEGSRRNLKLTTPEDLQMAASMLGETSLPSLRIGQGYDVHRLVEGRKLILCGVEVPHTLGLLGHSDADVALHALMDAMLGTMALGDIGKHFPDTDEQYRGISSMKLLEHVVSLLKDRRAMVTNCDVTIVAQKPKLLPYIPQMRENVAQALGIPADRVNIKATTTEKLGFEGQQEGISAQAVCMVMTQN